MGHEDDGNKAEEVEREAEQIEKIKQAGKTGKVKEAFDKKFGKKGDRKGR